MYIRKHYIEVDSLKGFAIFLVILGHSIIVFPIDLHKIYPWCEMLYNVIYLFHMPLFFFISGFCFSYHHDYKKLFIKRLVDCCCHIFVLGYWMLFQDCC